jgi:hypothetical protein
VFKIRRGKEYIVGGLHALLYNVRKKVSDEGKGELMIMTKRRVAAKMRAIYNFFHSVLENLLSVRLTIAFNIRNTFGFIRMLEAS